MNTTHNELVRAIVQRVSRASLDIDHKPFAAIGPGLVLLVGIHSEDEAEDAVKLADRIIGMRIFNDSEGKMNLSLRQAHDRSQILAVSNFTVYGDATKGRRPSFFAAAPYEAGKSLFDQFVEELKRGEVEVQTGQFGADMEVTIVNDGPVTLVIDTR